MKVLNLLSTGGVGGIEVLNKDIGKYSEDDNTFVFLYGTGVIYEQMKLEGMKTIDLSCFSFPVRMAKLYELSLQHDIIVSHHGSLGLSYFYVFLLMFNRRSRFVLTHHSCFTPKDYYPYKDVFRNTLRKFNLTYSIKKSDRIVYVSKAGMQSFFDAFDVDSKKARVVYNGINDDVLRAGSANIPRFDGELRLLYIGRLSKTKGVHFLLEALVALKDEFPVKAVIVGDGDEREKLMKYASENGIGGLVSFEGVQTEKQKYYEWANAFIYPSVYEVFGISIVEGLAYGLPCIANRVGGVPEIVDSDNGLLTETADTEGIENAVRLIYNKFCCGELKEMSVSAKKTAARFTVRNTVSQLHNIYEELMK